MPSSPPTPLKAGGPFLDLLLKRRSAPLIMGVVNVTGDSFFAGSRTPTVEAAVQRAQSLIEEGADILDVGGQSTRPGSDPIPAAEEIARTAPVIESLARQINVPISIDTDKAEVARKGRLAGASILNDVSALRNDPLMARAAVDFEAVILMHRGGASPKTMQQSPAYGDVVAEVKAFFEERVLAFVAAGGDRKRVLVDPGIGFGKDLGHNLSLLKHLREFSAVAPVVLGASRKSFLGRVTPDSGPEERLAGSLAAACWAALEGVKIVRVHDVAQTRRALAALAAIREAR